MPTGNVYETVTSDQMGTVASSFTVCHCGRRMFVESEGTKGTVYGCRCGRKLKYVTATAREDKPKIPEEKVPLFGKARKIWMKKNFRY